MNIMKYRVLAMLLSCAALLSACGGGGGGGDPLYGGNNGNNGNTGGSSDDDTTTETADEGSVALTLSGDTVSAATPITVSALIKDSNGRVLPGKLVDFSTKNGRGLLNNAETASALTNSQGVAVVTLTPKNASSTNADEVTASATVAAKVISASRGFQLTQSSVAISGFASSLGGSQLSAYGQTNLTVNVSGILSGNSATINLSSVCVAQGRAEISPATLTTTNGVGSFIYKDKGCAQGAAPITDSVTATLTGATSVSSNLSINIANPDVGSLTFDQASPEQIYLKGSGLTEVSNVSFVVRDSNSQPLSNRRVQLELLTLAGGITMDDGIVPVFKDSDSNGRVTVRISAGSVPTPVRVKGTVVGGTASTVSSNLAVGVGLPTQLNFVLAQETINIEGYDRVGTANTYTIVASDRTGNPVPVGTTVNFVTEGSGGQVVSSAQVQALSNGTSAAVAAFQSARAANSIIDGRMTVVAYAEGEESFKDLDGDNLYDLGEPFQDLGNFYKDVLFNGAYDSSTDEFVSTNINASSACVAAPALVELQPNVTVPTIAGTCDSVQGRAYVRRATETVLSTSAAIPYWPAPTWDNGSVRVAAAGCTTRVVYVTPGGSPNLAYARVGGSSVHGLPSTSVLTVAIGDANPDGRSNPVAAGSIVSVSATQGLSVSVTGGSPVPNTSSVSVANISLEFASGVTTGTVTLTVRSPSGLATSAPFNVTTAALGGATCAPTP